MYIIAVWPERGKCYVAGPTKNCAHILRRKRDALDYARTVSNRERTRCSAVIKIDENKMRIGMETTLPIATYRKGKRT